MKECLDEFKQWECEQIWPLGSDCDDNLTEAEMGNWPEQEDACQAEGPEGADLAMVFFLRSAWKAKRHSNDAAVRPPKRLTTGKHGYRIRKWVK